MSRWLNLPEHNNYTLCREGAHALVLFTRVGTTLDCFIDMPTELQLLTFHVISVKNPVKWLMLLIRLVRFILFFYYWLTYFSFPCCNCLLCFSSEIVYNFNHYRRYFFFLYTPAASGETLWCELYIYVPVGSPCTMTTKACVSLDHCCYTTCSPLPS